MIRWMRSARIASGKVMPALAWSREMAEFVNKYEGVSSVNVFLDMFGEVGTVRWIVDYEDLATLEKVRDQIFADQEYFQKVEKAKDLLIEGSACDVVMRSF
jgi:hypothetical protein